MEWSRRLKESLNAFLFAESELSYYQLPRSVLHEASTVTSKKAIEDISSSTEDITKAFELLPQLFAQSQKELDAQENAIKMERKALEEERELFGTIRVVTTMF